jgi:hypothetical protein
MFQNQDYPRWLRVKNNAAEDAPAFAALMVTGYEESTGAVTVERPDDDSLPSDRVIINGPVAIPVDAYGQVQQADPALALVSGTPVVGDAADGTLGTSADQWYLLVGNTGFAAWSGALSGKALVQKTGGTGDSITWPCDEECVEGETEVEDCAIAITGTRCNHPTVGQQTEQTVTFSIITGTNKFRVCYAAPVVTAMPTCGDFSSNTATAVANEVMLFADTTGKLGKRATGTGVAKLASGVLSASAVDVSGAEITGVLKAAAFPAQTGDVTNSAGSLANTITNGVITLAKWASGVLDVDGTLAANSDAKVASQKAVKTYVDALVAASDAMVFKGAIDANANPNYPAADRGHTYKISVTGRIGGASGPKVEAGDTLICTTDSTASGDHATVGGSWVILQVNIDGAVIGPASAVDANFVLFDGTSGKLVKDATFSVVPVAKGGTGATDASGARTNLGLAIGTHVQAWNAHLDTLAAIWATMATGDVIEKSAGGAPVKVTPVLMEVLLAGSLDDAEFNGTITPGDPCTVSGPVTYPNEDTYVGRLLPPVS